MATNTAPQLDSSIVRTLPVAAAAAGGIAVSQLVARGASDANRDPLGVGITALDDATGTWQFSLDGGATWRSIAADMLNSETNELALLLPRTALIRLQGYEGLGGNLANAVQFRAWDGTSGHAGDYVAVDQTGGSSAFSAATDTASLQAPIGHPNDAPRFTLPLFTGGPSLDFVFGGHQNRVDTLVGVDGTILVATQDFLQGPTVWRVLPDGRPDPLFHATGSVHVGGAASTYLGMLVQPDGTIVVSELDAQGQLVIARLNPADGSLVPSQGHELQVIAMDGDSARQVLQAPDGRLIVLAIGDGEVSVTHLLAAGAPDAAFATTRAAVAGIQDVTAARMQADGSIVLAVMASGVPFVVRLTPDGEIDSGFGTGGIVEPGVDGPISDLAIDAQGRIVVCGGTVARLAADGGVDLAPLHEWGNLISCAVQPDGSMVVVREGTTGVTAMRLLEDGSLDLGFGAPDGVVQGDTNLVAGPLDVAVQPDGRIVVVGLDLDAANPVEHFNLGLGRWMADGTRDWSFAGEYDPLADSRTLFIEDGPAVLLAPQAQVFDADLQALAAGAGNFAGASITLAREGGANAMDKFVGLQDLVLANGAAMLDGVVIGSYAQAAGSFRLTFNANATHDRVNEALQSLGYFSESQLAVLSPFDIRWTFDDGSGMPNATATFTTSVVFRGNQDAATGAPAIEGVAMVGQTLVAGGDFTDPDGVSSYEYQWLADGAELDGEWGPTLLITEALAGKAISVRVTVYDLRIFDTTRESAPTAPVALAATAGNDMITGSGANDYVLAGRGNDTIVGGAGSDVLDGGPGRDLFVFDSVGGVDTIAFERGADKLVFDQSLLGPIGDGDARVEGAVSARPLRPLPKAFEAVFIKSDALQAADAASVAALLGPAANGACAGRQAIVCASDAHGSAVYLFTSTDGDATLDANELTLMGVLPGLTRLAVNDLLFVA